jgi:hypothetical protein
MKSKSTLVKLILPILVVTFQTYAQEQGERKFAIGVHAAPTYSTLQKGSPFNNNTDYKPLMGLISGVSGQYNFCPRLALYAELNYEKAGYIYSPASPFGDYTDPPTIPCFVPIFSKSTITYNSITLPISLKYNFIQRNSIRVFANAGTLVNYTYSEDRSNYYEGDLREQVHTTYSYKLGNNYDPGALVGLGTDITLSKLVHLTLEIRDHLNLRTIDFGRRNAIGLLTGVSFQL